MNHITNDRRLHTRETAGSSGAVQIQVATGRRSLRAGALLIAVFSFGLITAGCFESKVVTSKVTTAGAGNSQDMNGVFYALPRTVVKADVPVFRINQQPGALAIYTPCFFPGEDFVVRKQSKFKVDADSIKFDTMFIPDTDEIYMIKTKGGMFETRNLELALTESGVLVKASADVSNDTIDIVTGTLKTGAGLAAKAIPIFLSSAVDSEQLDSEQQKCRSIAVDTWVEELELAGAGIIDASGNISEVKLAAVPQIPETLKNLRKFKDGYEKAKDIVDQINEIDTRRTTILAEQPSATPAVSTVHADSIRVVLDELDKTIKDLKDNYFLGDQSKLTWNASFRLNPNVDTSNPANNKLSIDLLTLSKDYGVCEIYVNQGVRLDPRFRIRKVCPNGAGTCKPSELQTVPCVGEKVRLDMALGEDGEGGPGGSLFADNVKNAHLNPSGNRGFYYRIPGRAIAFIRQTHEGSDLELGRAPLSIAQFGEVVSLPASTGGRKTKYTLELYEASGGLKNFAMGSSALIQQKNIDDLAGTASTLIDAKGERKKAKAPADELQQLERQRKILEERKKIRDLEKDLEEKGSDNNESNP